MTIHQPEHIPWLGFFHKLNAADVYVVLDNVCFRKNYFQNRNKIKTARGWQWITVPVHHSLATLIKDISITSDSKWKKNWLGSVSLNYRKAPYFNNYYEEIERVINGASNNLSQLNISLLKLLCNFLGIDTEFMLASKLSVKGRGSELILNLCKEFKADTYLSGISGKDYLQKEQFQKSGIKIEFQEFHHPIYKQMQEPFMPCMSVIDLLFNYGNESLNIINGIDISVMDEVFL